MYDFGYLEFSRALITLAWVLYLFVVAFSLGGQLLQDRRWVVGARHGMLMGTATLTAASLGLVAGFIKGDYHVKYIFDYSERGLPLNFKIAGLWAGLNGSILFWSLLISVVAGIVAFQFRRDEQHPVGRRLEPNVYIVFALVQLFFLTVIAFVANPFETLQEHYQNDFFRRFPGGQILDGAGLNPLLLSYWMQIHPPCLYFGWVTYTVPFAFGMAALISKEQGSYWLRKVRRWMLVGWLFNTSGVVLGGLWAYEVLGWGGYWAWDPVENSSFLPWLTATAFLHSVMVQERRNMLRIWNVFLVILTFVLSLFGTYLTRSGIVSSVHAFASGDVGNWFLGFLLLVIFSGLFLIALRFWDMRSRNNIESVFSREAIFVLNNMILVAIAFAIALLTLWPKISHEWFGQAITVSVPVYNLVTTPLFVLLLLLTAVGPGMGWIKTTRKNLLRNFGSSSLAALPLALCCQWLANSIRGGEGGELSWLQHLYPTCAVIYLACFTLTTLAFEVLRTAFHRARRRGGSLLESLTILSVRLHRRYGGYLVHVGLATLSIGVVSSSMFQVMKEKVLMSQGDQVNIGAYQVTMMDTHENLKDYVYNLQTVEMQITRDGQQVATVYPELRYYPQTAYRREPQTTREVKILRGLLQDFYIYFAPTSEPGSFYFTFYRNPLVALVWLGWLVMLAGGLWAALPMGRRRVGLSD